MSTEPAERTEDPGGQDTPTPEPSDGERDEQKWREVTVSELESTLGFIRHIGNQMESLEVRPHLTAIQMAIAEILGKSPPPDNEVVERPTTLLRVGHSDIEEEKWRLQGGIRKAITQIQALTIDRDSESAWAEEYFREWQKAEAQNTKLQSALDGFEGWMVDHLMGGGTEEPHPAGYANGVRLIATRIKNALEAK